MTSSRLLIAVIISLMVGGMVGYLGAASLGINQTTYRTAISTSTTTTTVTSTSTESVLQSVTATASQTAELDMRMALNNSLKPDLVVQSYDFAKGHLAVWMINNGTSPLILYPQVALLNGSTDSLASIFGLDPRIVQVGSYFYIPPKAEFIVQLDASQFLSGQVGLLQIFGDQWIFRYGTIKD